MNPFHKNFHGKIDKLSSAKKFHVCHESYPGINVVRGVEGPICQRCKQEHGFHCFPQWNNMDPSEQTPILSTLTQVG